MQKVEGYQETIIVCSESKAILRMQSWFLFSSCTFKNRQLLAVVLKFFPI